MVKKIIKVSANNAGIIIPKAELDNHGLKIGDEVKITLEADNNGSVAKVTIEYDPYYSQVRKNP